jgi:AcrR family transcriptional regulator
MPTKAASRTVRRPARKQRWNGSIAAPAEQRNLKRLAILATAAKMFVENGYHETSLADIAATLHVTKPTLYYYVSSKEEMLAQIAAAAMDESETIFHAAVDDGRDALDSLRLFMRAYAVAMTGDFGRCLLAARHARLAPQTRARLTAGFRRIDTMARELLERGVRDGSIRESDVRVTTFMLYGALNWIPHWFSADGTLSPADAGEAMFEVLAAGVASRRPAAGIATRRPARRATAR